MTLRLCDTYVTFTLVVAVSAPSAIAKWHELDGPDDRNVFAIGLKLQF